MSLLLFLVILVLASAGRALRGALRNAPFLDHESSFERRWPNDRPLA